MQNRRDVVADDREDQRGDEGPVTDDIAEEPDGRGDYVPHGVDKVLHRVRVIKLYTGRRVFPRRRSTRFPGGIVRPCRVARLCVEVL